MPWNFYIKEGDILSSDLSCSSQLWCGHTVSVALPHLGCHLAVVPIGPSHESQMHGTKGEMWGHQAACELRCVWNHQVSVGKSPGLSGLHDLTVKGSWEQSLPRRVTMEMMMTFAHASSSEGWGLPFEHSIQQAHSTSGLMMANWFWEVGLVGRRQQIPSFLLLLPFFSWALVLLCSPGWPRTHNAPQPFKFWYHRHVLSYLT